MKKIILSTSIMSTILLAQTLQSSNVSSLVDKIKIAKPEDKRILINELKLKLRDMNHATRQKAMNELRNSFGYKEKNGIHRNKHLNKNSEKLHNFNSQRTMYDKKSNQGNRDSQENHSRPETSRVDNKQQQKGK